MTAKKATAKKATGQTTTATSEPRKKVCNVQGCKKPATTLGLCDGHWMSRRGEHDPKPVPDRRKPKKG